MSESSTRMISIYTADFEASPQPQPFPLQGSKRAQVPIINQLIPPGKPRLIEPFCGSAAVSIGARFENRVEEVVISDTNLSLVSLWRDILEQPEALADRYEAVWAGQFEHADVDPISYFNVVRERYNDAVVGETADFLFLLNRIVKAALRYSKSGRMNQSADPRRTGAKPATVRNRLVRTYAVMKGAQVMCRDWREALADANTTDLIYLDPPYQGTTNTRDQRYITGMNVVDFELGISEAIDRGLSLIISYDALQGPAIYGRPLNPDLELLALDVITGVSAQGTLLGRRQAAHETLYLSPALTAKLGGLEAVKDRLGYRRVEQGTLLLSV